MTNSTTIQADNVAGLVYGGTWSMGPLQGPPPGWVMSCGGSTPCEGVCRVSFSLKSGAVQSFTVPCDQGMTVTFYDWSSEPVYLVEW